MRTVICLLFCLLAYPGLAQLTGDPRRPSRLIEEDWHKKAGVRKIRVYQVSDTTDKAPLNNLKDIIELDTLGNWTRIVSYSNDTINAQGLYTYDRYGRLLKQETLPNGNTSYFDYSSDGMKVHERRVNERMPEEHYYTFYFSNAYDTPLYALQYRLKRKKPLKRRENIRKAGELVDSTVFVFDRKGRLTEKQGYDKENRLIKKVIKTYGADNRPTHLVIEFEIKGSFIKINTWYDNRGLPRVLKRHMSLPGGNVEDKVQIERYVYE